MVAMTMSRPPTVQERPPLFMDGGISKMEADCMVGVGRRLSGSCTQSKLHFTQPLLALQDKIPAACNCCLGP
jgi:hypothetical protein